MASSQNLTKKMGPQFGLKLGGKLGESFGQTAKSAATTAMSTAKFGLDQVLLGLQHRGLNLEESRDLVQQVGRRVLERAEEIRKQLALSPLSPAWLKDVSLGGPAAIGAPLKADAMNEMSESDAPFSTTSPDADASQNLAESGSIVAAEAGSIVDATVSNPVVEMQPESMKSFLAEEKSKKSRTKSAKALHNLKPAKSAKRGKKAKKAKTVTVKAKTAAPAKAAPKAAPKAKAKSASKAKSKSASAAAHR